MILLQMRSCYILVMLNDMLGKTAKQCAGLWATLQNKDWQDRIGEADSCCMAGYDIACNVWTAMLQELLATNTVNVATVLDTCGVNPVTATAKSALKSVATKGGAGGIAGKAGDGDEEEQSQALFSVSSLFEFGSGDHAPPADALARLRLTIQEKLLSQAARHEKDLRRQLQVQVSLSSDAKGKAKPNSELMLKIEDVSCLVSHPRNHELKMFKMEKKLQLMYYGEVCCLTKEAAICSFALEGSSSCFHSCRVSQVTMPTRPSRLERMRCRFPCV